MKQNLIDAAERYTLADKSDPFALARAKCHLRNGVASYATPDGGKGYYDAELINGVYHNVCRP